MGRAQDVQVCPDPDNERIAVCAGGRCVRIYTPNHVFGSSNRNHKHNNQKSGGLGFESSMSIDGEGDGDGDGVNAGLTLEATLTGFTGSVVRCAWHYFREPETGDKTYLLATTCDDGQLLIHQQNMVYVSADSAASSDENDDRQGDGDGDATEFEFGVVSSSSNSSSQRKPNNNNNNNNNKKKKKKQQQHSSSSSGKSSRKRQQLQHSREKDQQSYVAGLWTVTFGHQRADTKQFVMPTLALQWMPSGALNDHDHDHAAGRMADQPFVLAAGSDRLTLVCGWLSRLDRSIAWKVKSPLLHSPADNGMVSENGMVTALAWAPQRQPLETRQLVAAVGCASSGQPAAFLKVFDLKKTTRRSKAKKTKSKPKQGPEPEPEPEPELVVGSYELCCAVEIKCDDDEWHQEWVRDLAWTSLPYAHATRIVVAFRNRLLSVTRTDDRRWHLRRIQVFRTNRSNNCAPTEFKLSQELGHIWHLAWSRHNTLLALTADTNTTVVIRKVVAGNMLPEIPDHLPVGAVVRVARDNGALTFGTVIAHDGDNVTVELDDKVADPERRRLKNGQRNNRRSLRNARIETVPVDRVQHAATALENIYDATVGTTLQGTAPAVAGEVVAPTRLTVKTVSTHVKEEAVVTGGVEMWEIVNEAQLNECLRLEKARQ